MVRVTREGDEPAQKDIDVISGEKLGFALAPRAKPRLATTAMDAYAAGLHPTGAELAIDGRRLGAAPWSGNVEPGGHPDRGLLDGLQEGAPGAGGDRRCSGARSLVELELPPPPPKWYRRWYVWTVPLVLIAGAVAAGQLGYVATHQPSFRPVEWGQ